MQKTMHEETIPYTTAKAGRYSSKSTWVGGKVPPDDSALVINHKLTVDMDIHTCGITINPAGHLVFDPRKNITVNNCENFIRYGGLSMHPASAAFNHVLLFHDIDESTFVGATMDHMDIRETDHGLWVRGNGILDLVGAPRTLWTNLTSGVLKGAKSILVKDATAWRVGDELCIAPTTPITDKNFYKGFDYVSIQKIVKKVIYLDKPLEFDHPAAVHPNNGNTFYAEVINTTSNVRIEGTPTGRAHINIMAEGACTISNVTIRHMGPQINGEVVKGRYPLHFHMNGNSMAGTILRNVLIMDSGGHAFVTHASHGIKMIGCATLRVQNHAYWWDTPVNNSTDPSNNSNNISYIRCLAAQTMQGARPFYRLSDFFLGSGTGNMICKCVGVGNNGDKGSAMINYPESSNMMDNNWIDEDNIAHNIRSNGMMNWQNDDTDHQIKRFTAYNCGLIGIEQGAYTNGYKFDNIQLFGNGLGIKLYSLPSPNGIPDQWGYIVHFKDVDSADGLLIVPHTLVGKGRTLFLNCKFSSVEVKELPRVVDRIVPGLFDFVDCSIDSLNCVFMEDGSIIRVQDDAGCVQIDDTKEITDIQPFFQY